MNLELDEHHFALRSSVRAFLERSAGVSGHTRALLSDARGTTGSVWQGLATLGVTGLLVPEEHGGSGAALVDALVVLEELGAALYSGPWLSAAVAAPRALYRFGAGSADALSTAFAAGSTIATVGPLDPGSRRPQVSWLSGNTVLNGRLHAVPDAAAAQILLVFADSPDGIGLFSVPTADPTVGIVRRSTVDLTRRVFDITLDDTPATELATGGMAELVAVRDDVFAAYAADAVGAARAVTDLVIAYAKVRHQFGRPIGSFQAVQHLCVDMYETVELAYGGAVHALWAADHPDDEQRTRAALHAKAYSRNLATVGDNAIQVLGGLGYTDAHDAHLYLRRLLGWSTFLGGGDRYLEQVGRHVVGACRSM
ncbi:acyl-CoA dehydrogenase family protein [Nocardia sp. NPDC058499]|uniref:acyl-CoA dehydrogenase family protein n=1 Tax=Nocardia sp. NPDC058499 TaxID=3346530 RepID=UPI00365E9A40